VKLGSSIPNSKQIAYAGCVRTLLEASWFSILEHLPHSSKVFHSHSAVDVSKESQINAEAGLKLFPPL